MGTQELDSQLQKRADAVFESFTRSAIVKQILEQLEHNLPRDLRYHAVQHTYDVLREAILFAVIDDRTPAEQELLAIAAAYHDAGFLTQAYENEGLGAEIARRAMGASKTYSQADIEQVTQMILDTKLLMTGAGPRQLPTTPLSGYLLDADLSNLGRPDFFEKSELQRAELGIDEILFLPRTYALIANHVFYTPAARRLRQRQKEENLRKLQTLLANTGLEIGGTPTVNVERLKFLARLPVFLNSTLDVRQILGAALKHLATTVHAEAATVFLLNPEGTTLNFWALEGGDESRLEGKQMPAGKGIVGWVINQREAVLVRDAQNDARFFKEIDREGGFKTKNMICAPLVVRGDTPLGAIQVLNCVDKDTFSEEDLEFVGQFAHQVAMAVDNAQLYARMVERNRALETLDRRKDEMIALLAHEFRTPLNIIQASADVIGSGTVKDPKIIDAMNDTLKRGVTRLSKVCGDIKTMNSLAKGDGNVELSRQKISVADLVATVSNRFVGALQKRKLHFEQSLDSNAPSIEGDFVQLAVVLHNLLSNAIRFTPDEGTVSISVTRAAGMVRFDVRDTGIGIAKDQQPLIFEKFYEVVDSMEHSSGNLEFKSCGMGLGLSAAKAILKAHGAAIEVSSDVGKGSCFTFRLPVAGE